MDIPVPEQWEQSRAYKKHDIVHTANLAFPDDDSLKGTLAADDYISKMQPFNFINDDEGYAITFDYDENADVSNNLERQLGFDFDLNPSFGYTAKCMIKKSSEQTESNDDYVTIIEEKLNTIGADEIDLEESIGVGIGVKFYNLKNKQVRNTNVREYYRMVAMEDLSHRDFLYAQVDIPDNLIPEDAVTGRVYIVVAGLKSGGLIFKKPGCYNLSSFFYCKKDHNSSVMFSPNGSLSKDVWDQHFFWRPSYGSTASFAAQNEIVKMGEGYDQVTNRAINCLPMELSLKFENRTDQEAKSILHFLQEKFFPYDSMFSINYKGERLLSNEVSKFKFEYSYPYKKDLRYTCLKFAHEKSYRNNNNIAATFLCNTESTIESVDSHFGYNRKIDAIIPVSVDAEVELRKGEAREFNLFSLDAANEEKFDSESNAIDSNTTGNVQLRKIVKRISRYPEDETLPMVGGVIEFKKDYVIATKTCMFLEVKPPNQGSIFNSGNIQIQSRIDARRYMFTGILEEDGGFSKDPVEWPTIVSPGAASRVGQGLVVDDKRNTVIIDPFPLDEIETVYEDIEDSEIPYSLIRLSRCPSDCVSSQPTIPSEVTSIKEVTQDSNGNTRPREVFLKNYRKVKILNEISASTTSVTLEPTSDFTVSEDFNLHIPAIYGRSSIYINDPDEIVSYQFLKVRSFDFKPSQAFSIEHSPKNLQTQFTKVYKKYTKRSINQNLSTFNVSFYQRSDKEAKEILLFLEAHLGYKKFRFQMPRPYGKDLDHQTTGSTPSASIFYCPSWSHTNVYKNNNTITASFIESATSIPEDLRSVFGVGQPEEGTCYGAEIYNPITSHSLCVLSSTLEAAYTRASYFRGGSILPYSPPPRPSTLGVHFSSLAIQDNFYDLEHEYAAGIVNNKKQYGGVIKNGPCTSQAFVQDQFSNLVGPGEYPVASIVIPNILSVSSEPEDEVSRQKGKLESISIGPLTQVEMYDQENYQGNLVLNVMGPALIYNNYWVELPDRFTLWDQILERSVYEFDYQFELGVGVQGVWTATKSENSGNQAYLPVVRDKSWLYWKGLKQSNVKWAKNSWREIGSIKVRYLG
jgi:phage-related protein